MARSSKKFGKKSWRLYLFIISEGERPEIMMKRLMDLASQLNSRRMKLLPMASAVADET